MHGTAAPLLGRDDDLARLRALARGRLPAISLVGGPAGVGKSSVARALAASWDGPVLIGHGDPLVPQPFGLLREAVARHLTDRPELSESLDGEAAALLNGTAGGPGREAAALLNGTAGGPGREAKADQDALLRTAVALLRRLASPAPALLVLDDLHWADAASVALVSRVARAGDLPVVVVGTYRPEDARPPLARMLADLGRRADVHVTRLRGLSRSQVAALVRARTGQELSPRLAAALHERTAGNPLFVEELATAVVGTDPDTLIDQPLPRSVAEAVLARFAGLDDEAVDVAEAAAIDSTIDFGLLERVVGADPVPALRRLVDAGLLTEPQPDCFAFRHELVREAVASRMLARERRRRHDRAYVALRGLGCDDEARLARHARLSGRDADLVRHARRGAEARLAEGSPLEALALAEQGLAADPAAPRLAHVAAQAARNLGFYGEAADHARSALHLARARDERGGQVEAHLLLAEVHGATGDLRALHAELDSARGVAVDAASRARCESVAARVLMLEEQFEAALQRAEQALALAGEAGLGEIVAATDVTRGTAMLSLPGREREGLAVLEAGRERALAEGDTFTVSRALLNGLTLRSRASEAPRAWRAIEEARAYVSRHGLDSIGGNLTRVAADLAVSEGDQSRAERLLRDRLAEEVDRVEEAAIAAKAGLLALERGDDAAAASLLERYLPDAERIEQHWVRTYLRLLAVAHAARTDGPVEATLVAYRDAVAPPAHALRAGRAAEAARWALHAGVRLPVIDRFLADTLKEADPADSWWRAQLDVVRAEAAGDDGAVLADRAFADPRLPHWTADIHVRKARAATRLGLAEVARDHAQRACGLLANWPGWRREAATALAHQLGQDSALTPREREVLALIAEGLSNQRIATALGISPRTVAVHVSSILRKTGLTSRLEAAAWAIRGQPADG